MAIIWYPKCFAAGGGCHPRVPSLDYPAGGWLVAGHQFGIELKSRVEERSQQAPYCSDGSADICTTRECRVVFGENANLSFRALDQ